MAFDGIFFDLDGTLWDSVDTLVRSWQETCASTGSRRFGSREGISGLMGMTCEEILSEFVREFGDTGEELYHRCIAAENAYLARDGGHLYPGLEEMLRILSERCFLAIVSNGPVGYIESFLSFYGFDTYFRDFLNQGTTRRPKGENIRLVAERNGLKNILYVGDTERDETAARTAGCAFVHAAYGFGTAQAPDGVIHAPMELPALIEHWPGK